MRGGTQERAGDSVGGFWYWGLSSGIVVMGSTFGDCEFCIECIIEGTGYAEACLSRMPLLLGLLAL